MSFRAETAWLSRFRPVCTARLYRQERERPDRDSDLSQGSRQARGERGLRASCEPTSLASYGQSDRTTALGARQDSPTPVSIDADPAARPHMAPAPGRCTRLLVSRPSAWRIDPKTPGRRDYDASAKRGSRDSSSAWIASHSSSICSSSGRGSGSRSSCAALIARSHATRNLISASVSPLALTGCDVGACSARETGLPQCKRVRTRRRTQTARNGRSNWPAPSDFSH
jgi:hypothetical protein